MDIDKMLENERLKEDLQEVEVFCFCDRCSNEIYMGNYYYEHERNRICEECFEEFQADEKYESRRIAGDDDE